MAHKATAPDYKALRKAAPGQGGRPTKFSAEVAAARRREQNRRFGDAQSRATTALKVLHPEDWRSLYDQAFAEVDAESGPLPGDES